MNNDSDITPRSGESAPPAWERNLLSKIALAAVTEQRRARRWGIFFKLLFFTYLLVTTWLFYSTLSGNLEVSSSAGDGGKHTAVVRVDGLIAGDSDASAGIVNTGLRAAFDDENTAGVVLLINSPGGSPVQAGQIYDAITQLRAEHPDTPLYAVITDVCASGGYYIAAAAQEIYADKASIVGSIGVRADSFGFVDAMQKFGVERRLYTSGQNKALLDPFSPEQPEQVAHFESLLDEVHQQFIDAVKSGRGERLQDNPDVFSGLVWTGEQSLELGLIDGLGSVRWVAKELIKAEELIDFTPRSGLLDRALSRLGVSIAAGLGDVLTPQLR